jgi:hypothetical protein
MITALTIAQHLYSSWRVDAFSTAGFNQPLNSTSMCDRRADVSGRIDPYLLVSIASLSAAISSRVLFVQACGKRT